MRMTSVEGGVPVSQLTVWRWVPEVAHMAGWFEGYRVRTECAKHLNHRHFKEAVAATVRGE